MRSPPASRALPQLLCMSAQAQAIRTHPFLLPHSVGRAVAASRYKDKEIRAFREKVPLAQLAAMVKSAPPPRDFKAALVAKQQAYGA